MAARLRGRSARGRRCRNDDDGRRCARCRRSRQERGLRRARRRDRHEREPLTAPDRLLHARIAIGSANTHAGFLATTQSKLLAFEKAARAADAAAIAPLVGANVSYFAKPKPPDEAAAELAKVGRLPDAWSYDVRRRVTLESGIDPTWTADCQNVARHAADVAVFTTRYVWGGPDAAIVSISSLAVTRPFSPL